MSFNGVSRQFLDEIYGTSKGYIRLNVLWHDLVTEIPELLGGGLRILDAGGGDGRVSRKLVHQGNRIVLCDSSKDMLDEAKKWISHDSVVRPARPSIMAILTRRCNWTRVGLMSDIVTFEGKPPEGTIHFGVGQPSADLLPIDLMQKATPNVGVSPLRYLPFLLRWRDLRQRSSLHACPQ